jgi:hypothetical protein
MGGIISKATPRVYIFVLFCLSLFAPNIMAAQEVLRGEVVEELEPLWAVYLGEKSPLDNETVSRWALEDSAEAFSAMIYGWYFEYVPGEKARGIREHIELKKQGEIVYGDSALRVSDTKVLNGALRMCSDYELSPEQSYRVRGWKGAMTVGVNATGHSPLQGLPISDTQADAQTYERKTLKFAALEDAASLAIRSYMRTQTKLRPRLICGYIALSQFPDFNIVNGMWASRARFRLQISEVVSFAAY